MESSQFVLNNAVKKPKCGWTSTSKWNNVNRSVLLTVTKTDKKKHNKNLKCYLKFFSKSEQIENSLCTTKKAKEERAFGERDKTDSVYYYFSVFKTTHQVWKIWKENDHSGKNSSWGMMGIITLEAVSVLRKSKYWIEAGNKNTRPQVARIVLPKLKEK